jgi:hypothetical protein
VLANVQQVNGVAALFQNPAHHREAVVDSGRAIDRGIDEEDLHRVAPQSARKQRIANGEEARGSLDFRKLDLALTSDRSFPNADAAECRFARRNRLLLPKSRHDLMWRRARI